VEKNMIVLFLGPSGCGKDTQAQKLIKEYGFIQLSAGDFFRNEILDGGKLGKKLKKYLDSGVLVPNELWYEIVKKHLTKNLSKGRIILQGVVREVVQKELVDDILDKLGYSLNAVIHFDLSVENAIERMALRRSCPKCGQIYHLKFTPPKKENICDKDGEKLIQREDDTEKAINSRISYYQDNIKPILKYYEDRKILYHIDGGETIPNVYKQLVELLENL